MGAMWHTHQGRSLTHTSQHCVVVLTIHVVMPVCSAVCVAWDPAGGAAQPRQQAGVRRGTSSAHAAGTAAVWRQQQQPVVIVGMGLRCLDRRLLGVALWARLTVCLASVGFLRWRAHCKYSFVDLLSTLTSTRNVT